MRSRQLAACLAALLFAALVPACIFAGLSRSVLVLPFALGITLGHALLLGLPLFLLFRLRRWVNAVSSICAGFVIGALPAGVLTWPLRASKGSSASINGVSTLIDGVPTVAGWFYYAQSLVYLGLFGALGGFVFWIILRWSGELPTTGHSAERRYRNAAVSTWLALVAVSLSAAVAAIPSITKDRTCHNMFRDGRTSVTPALSLDLDIGMDDWAALTKIFEDFGMARKLSLRNSSKQLNAVRVLALDLCNDQGVNVSVLQQRWASKNFAPVPARGVPVTVYEVRQNSGWKLLARDLIGRLESAWPGKVRFRDGGGHLVPTPADLRDPVQ